MPSKSQTLLLHLALIAAGWGIAAALLPLLSASPSSAAAESATAPTKLPRPELDRPGGQRLLERLSREMEPGTPPAPDFWTGLSLEEKTDLLIRKDREPDREPLSPAGREKYRKSAIFHDLERIVRGRQGPDLAYAFRHGRIEAQEISDQLAARLPGHAATPGFSAMLYEILAIEDPRRAETLLDSLPVPEQLERKDWLFAIHGGFEDPDIAYELIATIPWRDDPDGQAARREKWEHCAQMNLTRHPGDYLTWLQSLPRGRERDLAISAALEPVSKQTPAEVPRLRALIDDPVIRESR